MDWLSTLAGNLSSIYGLCLVLLVATIVFILLRTGSLSVKTSVLRLGDNGDAERKIIRQQLAFLRASAEGMISKLPQNLEIWQTKYILSKICDILEEAILFNHINREERYVSIKQQLVYNAVMKRVTDDYFMTEEFKNLCNEFTRNMIDEFVNIREIYGKEK